MLKRNLTIFLMLLIPSLAGAAPRGGSKAVKLVQKFATRAELSKSLRALGYKARGGVDKAESDRDEQNGASFPHFSSSFSVGGATFPFTMVGHPPATGKSARLRSVIIPLRMNFVGFGINGDVSHSFDPSAAVQNIVHSPLYREAKFPNGVGQFGDQMQRAAFWNRMDRDHSWHVRMGEPVVARTIDVEVTPETGSLALFGTYWTGDVLIDFMDAQILTILQFMDIGPDELPIFVTGDVTAQALGYHSAFSVPGEDGGTSLQTYTYTSWLDPAQVDPLFADVSTFNHELLEWMNDPFINNVVPTWNYPPPSDPNASCSFNNLLEVGDPQGNGPTFSDYPTVPVVIDGVTYHLQQLVLLQWFTDEVPSSAQNGWYTFPDPSSVSVPAVYCK